MRPTDFVGSRRRWWTISGVLLQVSILALIIFRLELSVDFTGGLVVNVPNPAGAQVEDVRNAIDPLGESDARIQLVAGGEAVRIQTGFTDDPPRWSRRHPRSPAPSPARRTSSRSARPSGRR